MILYFRGPKIKLILFLWQRLLLVVPAPSPSLPLTRSLSLSSSNHNQGWSRPSAAQRCARSGGMGPDGFELVGLSSALGQTPSLASLVVGERVVASRCRSAVLRPFSPWFLGPNKFISNSSSIWYSLFPMKVPKSSDAFLCKTGKLCKWIWAKWSLILRYRSRIHTHDEQFFPKIYNLSIFEVVYKNLHFSRQSVKMLV